MTSFSERAGIGTKRAVSTTLDCKYVNLFSQENVIYSSPRCTVISCHEIPGQVIAKNRPAQWYFLGIFVFKPKWGSCILGRCRKSGNHSKEDLARSGYKPCVKHKTLIILRYFGLHTILFFPSFLAIEKLLKSVHFQTFNFNFLFSAKFRSYQNKAGTPPSI